MNLPKFSAFTFFAFLASSHGQNIYTNPTLSEFDYGGADLIRLSAGDTNTSWIFELQFANETLDEENLAFHLIVDTDLMGTPSRFLGYPTRGDFGDDLYLYYHSSQSLTPRLGIRQSAESASYSYPSNLLNFESNRITIEIPRDLAPATAGNAEFIFLLGVPSTDTSFSISHKFASPSAPEFKTATVPEPKAASLLIALFATLYVAFRRNRIRSISESQGSPASVLVALRRDKLIGMQRIGVV